MPLAIPTPPGTPSRSRSRNRTIRPASETLEPRTLFTLPEVGLIATESVAIENGDRDGVSVVGVVGLRDQVGTERPPVLLPTRTDLGGFRERKLIEGLADDLLVAGVRKRGKPGGLCLRGCGRGGRSGAFAEVA